MRRVRKAARSLETALDIVETGIEKIVANIRATAPEARRPAPGVVRTKGSQQSSPAARRTA